MSPDLLVVLGATSVLCFTVVMLLSTRHRSLEALKIDIRPDEHELDRIDIDGRFNRKRLVATTHRIVLQEVHWFLARTRTTCLPMHDLDGSQLEHRMNPWILVAGILLFAQIAPIGLLLIILALTATRYRLFFGTRNHRIAFTLPGTGVQAMEVTRFFRQVQRQREALRGAPGLATSLLEPLPGAALRVVGAEAWLGVLAMMLVGSIQRYLFGGVDLDSAFFLAAYSAIPALVGARAGARDGFVTGFFGFIGLISILYPLPRSGLLGVGDQAPILAYLLGAMVGGSIGAGAGAARTPFISALAAAVLNVGWLLVATSADAASAGTAGLMATVCLAAAASSMAAGFGRSVGASTQADRRDVMLPDQVLDEHRDSAAAR